AIGTLVGLVAAIVQRTFWPGLNEIWQFVFILAIGFIGTVTATLLTEPTDPEVLKNMYMKTRPFGVWGHLKKTLSAEEQAKMTREHRNDLLAVPFALTWQAALFLAPMLFIIHNWHDGIVIAVTGVIAFAGLYFIWFRNQPKDNFYND
ncbi:MAG: hypothetical protein MUC65_01235, partial [Pontiellaceae bacterium]|nr:hypothetical protein [Pontiellaceae bacterium]